MYLYEYYEIVISRFWKLGKKKQQLIDSLPLEKLKCL